MKFGIFKENGCENEDPGEEYKWTRWSQGLQMKDPEGLTVGFGVSGRYPCHGVVVRLLWWRQSPKRELQVSWTLERKWAVLDCRYWIVDIRYSGGSTGIRTRCPQSEPTLNPRRASRSDGKKKNSLEGRKPWGTRLSWGANPLMAGWVGYNVRGRWC
jgi:hypothetical protein